METIEQTIKDFIFEAMEKYYRTCYCDRYGQINTIDVYQVFKDKTDEVLEYLKEDRIIEVNLYGGRFGTYKGINAWGGLKDDELMQRCKKAFSNNPSRNNMNNW